MTLIAALEAVRDSPVGHIINASNHMVGAFTQVVHVLGFVLLLASVVLINLRLVGWAFRAQRVPDVAVDLRRLILIGLAMTVLSGTLMFCASPLLYYRNPAFLVKMVLLLGAVLLQYTLYRRVTGQDAPAAGLARGAAAASLLLWLGVGAAGRTIGLL
ncbi:MAG: hypothetical protein QM718_07500 [Steroidobacteraceae bacterium]